MNLEKWYRIDQLDPHSSIRREKISTGVGRYLHNFLKLVITEKQPFIMNELVTLGKKLNNPFPYRDTQKIYNHFYDYFLEDDTLNADLSSYWMTINASFYYIIKGKTKEIYQKNLFLLLNKSFFDTFDQYKFLEEEIKSYPNLYSEYLIHEHIRIYILHYLFVEKRNRINDKS